jgi:hypothetical protein
MIGAFPAPRKFHTARLRKSTLRMAEILLGAFRHRPQDNPVQLQRR